MIELIRQIRDSGKAHILLSSHLLRDVEECCEEILIVKQGRIAVYCNLEEERKSNLKFLEIETRGDREAFVEAIATLGCEYALTSERRLKLIRRMASRFATSIASPASKRSDSPAQLQARLARRYFLEGNGGRQRRCRARCQLAEQGGAIMAVYEHAINLMRVR